MDVVVVAAARIIAAVAAAVASVPQPSRNCWRLGAMSIFFFIDVK